MYYVGYAGLKGEEEAKSWFEKASSLSIDFPRLSPRDLEEAQEELERMLRRVRHT